MATINIPTFISSALGLTLALSWNNAIGKTINTYYPDDHTILHAILITIIIMVVLYFINWMNGTIIQKIIYKYNAFSN